MRLLAVESLTKRYQGLTAVSDLSFSVGEGEIVGLIGPNGAGKTTTLSLLSGYLPADGGTVLFGSTDVTRLPSWSRADLGLIRTFQGTLLFSNLSVEQHVLLGSHHNRRHPFLPLLAGRAESQRARDLSRMILERVGLSTSSVVRAGDLPYAHQKILGIATAVAAGPKLLLLDEPMAGMNPSEADQMMAILRSLHQEGLSLLVVEHNMRAVMSLSHRVVVLHHGRRLAVGTPEQVQSDPDVIEAYLGGEYASA